MIEYENHLGLVDLSESYFFDLVSAAVVSCFGVVGMSDRPLGRGVLDAFTTKQHHRGIAVRVKNDALLIDLHIFVLYGVNMAAVVKSIINKVTYQVETATALQVAQVNVYIDDIKGEE